MPICRSNMFLDDKGAAAELAHWKSLAEHRRERARKYAADMERDAVRYQVRLSQP